MMYTPADKSIYDIRRDCVLLRQGRPVFPLMAYHVRQRDLRIVANTAFNIVQSWTTTYPPAMDIKGDGAGFIEAAREAGLIGVVGGGGLYYKDRQERTARHYRGNPHQIFYYVDDEPHGPGRQPADMLTRHEKWNRWDPTHPTFLLHNRPAEFARYSPACDIFATDSYPLRRPEDTDMTRVATWTRAAVEAVHWRKPVWIALQCYTTRSTEARTKSRDQLPRLPTPAELRCMSYMALAEGARGLLYYAFDDTYYNRNGIRGVNLAEEYPDFWAEMAGVIAELASHADIWTMPNADMAMPTCDNGRIVAQRRPYCSDGKIYVLVVNPQRSVQTVQVKLESLRNTANVKDALGGTSATIREGTIRDELQPLAAKCYVVE